MEARVRGAGEPTVETEAAGELQAEPYSELSE